MGKRLWIVLLVDETECFNWLTRVYMIFLSLPEGLWTSCEECLLILMIMINATRLWTLNGYNIAPGLRDLKETY